MSLKISMLHTKTSVWQVKSFNQLYLEIMIKYGTLEALST
jgi:hypothetical protein